MNAAATSLWRPPSEALERPSPLCRDRGKRSPFWNKRRGPTWRTRLTRRARCGAAVEPSSRDVTRSRRLDLRPSDESKASAVFTGLKVEAGPQLCATEGQRGRISTPSQAGAACGRCDFRNRKPRKRQKCFSSSRIGLAASTDRDQGSGRQPGSLTAGEEPPLSRDGWRSKAGNEEATGPPATPWSQRHHNQPTCRAPLPTDGSGKGTVGSRPALIGAAL